MVGNLRLANMVPTPYFLGAAALGWTGLARAWTEPSGRSRSKIVRRLTKKLPRVPPSVFSIWRWR